MTNDARLLVTVTEILDAARFRGTYRGQAYEGRALPDTSYLTEGDAAFCHVLPNSELVAVFTPTTGPLYVAPGYAAADGWCASLWRLENGTLSKVWVCPVTDTNITLLVWNHAKQKLFVWVTDRWWENVSIYAFDPATDTAALVAGPYTASSSGSSVFNPAIQAAEKGGKYYVSHGGYNDDHFVFRFDPDTNANDQVGFVAGGSGATDGTYGSGGIACRDGELVWNTGGAFYTSPDGTTWTRRVNLNDYMVLSYDPYSCGAVYDPASDKVYLGAYRRNHTIGIRKYYPQIWSYDGATFSVEYESAGENDDSNKPVSFAVAPTEVYGAQWGYGLAADSAVSGRNSGSWASAYTVPAAYYFPAGRSLVWHNKTLYGLVVDDNDTRLIRLLTDGAWETVQQFVSHYLFYTTENVGAMAVAQNKQPQEY